MSDFIKFRVDDNMKEFDKVFSDYMKWQKRQPADIVNAKLYFIALQAMRNTKTANKVDIANQLRAASREHPEVPLAAILVNKQLKAAGKKGLSGMQMATAVEKLIRKQQSHTQFLRSGWLPAVKTLDYYNKRGDISFVRRFAPKKPDGVKQTGKDKGRAIYARADRDKTWGLIGNYVGQGKQETKTVHEIVLQGLKAGISSEIVSMRQYIERKHHEQFQKMNHKNI